MVTVRFPVRPIVAAAGIELAAAGTSLQIVDSYVGVVAVFVFLEMTGGTALSIVGLSVSHWSNADQEREMGITMTDSCLGVLGFPFVLLVLFDRMDIHAAFTTGVGAAALVVLASSRVYRRNRPSDSGSSENRRYS